MRPVPNYTQHVTAGNLPRVQPSLAAPVFWQEMARGFEKKGQAIAVAAEEKYTFELNALRKKEIARIETEYAANPAGMQQAFQKNKEGFLSGIQSADIREKFDVSYELDTLAPMARATNAKIKQQDAQKKELAFQNIALSETAIEQNIDSLFSQDPEQMMAGGVVIQKSLMDIQNALSVRNHDGSSVFSAEQVARGMKPYVERMGELAVMAYLKNAPDKNAALMAFSEGKVEISLPDGKGDLQKINLMEAMSEETKLKTRRQVEAYLNDLKFDADYQDVQMKAQYRKERADFDIAMSRGEVNYQGIEEAYNKGMINEEERATYVKKLDDKSGGIYRFKEGYLFDPKSAQDKKAVDYLYQSLVGQEPNPQAQLQAGVNISVQTGIMPEQTRSFLRASLRSGQPEEAVQAAEAMQVIGRQNPQILNDLSKEDIALGTMILSNVSRGVPPQEAYLKAQESLQVPLSDKTARKKYYQDEKMAKDNSDALQDYFKTDPWGFDHFKVPEEMKYDYDSFVEEEYIRSGDIDSARQTAGKMLERVWGKTQIGGRQRMMKNAPEMVYGISGLSLDENTKWIEEQLLSEIQSKYLWTPEQFKKRQKSVFLNVSQRTVRGGPAYDILWTDEEGVIHMLDGVFVPDFKTSPYYQKSQDEIKEKVEQARKDKINIYFQDMEKRLNPFKRNPFIRTPVDSNAGEKIA